MPASGTSVPTPIDGGLARTPTSRRGQAKRAKLLAAAEECFLISRTHRSTPAQKGTLMATAQELSDLEDIRRLNNDYFFGLDTGDIDILMSVFVEDAVFGHNAALACHMANESYFRKSAVTWDAASGQIKS